MRRREFLAVLGGAAAAWPLAARAQQPGPMRRDRHADGLCRERLGRDRPGLRRSGRASRSSGGCEGRNIQIDIRWATPQAALMQRFGSGARRTADPTFILFGKHTDHFTALLQQTRTISDHFCGRFRTRLVQGSLRASPGRAATSPALPISEPTMGGKWFGVAQGDCARRSPGSLLSLQPGNGTVLRIFLSILCQRRRCILGRGGDHATPVRDAFKLRSPSLHRRALQMADLS